jgi:type I restriction enzyme S subunit
MKKWKTVKLGKICDLKNGSAFKPTDWGKVGLPIVRIQNLNDSKKPFNYWGGDVTRKVLISPGDVLLAWSGTPGTSFGTHLWRGPKGVLNQHIFRVDLDEKVITREWAVPAINQQLVALIARAHGGVGLQHVKRSEVEALEIPLPELHEQKRIATTLDSQLSAIDEARQAAERRVKAAEALEAALFREAFHGQSPVRIGLPKDAAPQAWSWQRLITLAELESGHTPSRRQPTWWGGDIPWISLPDIRALDGKVAMETKENTNALGIANSSARILPQDTVMLSRTASVGFVAMMGRPMATSQDFVNWVCGAALSPRFLMHALRASRDHFLANASGAIHKTLYMPAVKDFHLCLPSRKQQEKITAHLDQQLADAATLLTAARAELAAIQALPAAVLRRVFGGEASG